MKLLLASLRILSAAFVICSVVYPLVVLGFARAAAPVSAEGSLVHAADGAVVGSRLIAQSFTSPRYFWPRPSAVDHNAAAAAGSNLSPAGQTVRARGGDTVTRYGATPDRPLPADLATTSGSGLDPHISRAGAEYQVARVAAARGLPADRVRDLLPAAGAVNVLELNLALDALSSRP